MRLDSFEGCKLRSSSREMSTSFGTRAAANFFRAARSGRNDSPILAPSLSPCSTTVKLADAPGWSAAMPMGVMLGSEPTAGRIVTSDAFGSRSRSSMPISNRIASMRKYPTGFGQPATTSL